jgi:hypothetical protein
MTQAVRQTAVSEGAASGGVADVLASPLADVGGLGVRQA